MNNKLTLWLFFTGLVRFRLWLYQVSFDTKSGLFLTLWISASIPYDTWNIGSLNLMIYSLSKLQHCSTLWSRFGIVQRSTAPAISGLFWHYIRSLLTPWHDLRTPQSAQVEKAVRRSVHLILDGPFLILNGPQEAWPGTAGRTWERKDNAVS